MTAMSDAGSDAFATAGPDQDAHPLASTVERVMAEGHVPGLTLAVVRHDRLLHAAGFGFADLAERRPSTATTQHLWFSMSKIATATAAVRMAERGELDLDAPIRHYVDGYPRGAVVPEPTVGQLLNHTAGLANPVPVRWVRPAEAPAPDPAAFLARRLRRHGRPKHTIGGAARYSNLGFLVLAQAMAVAADRPFEAHRDRDGARPCRHDRDGLRMASRHLGGHRLRPGAPRARPGTAGGAAGRHRR